MKTVKLPAYFLKNIVDQTNNALKLGGVDYQLKGFSDDEEKKLRKFMDRKVPEGIADQIKKVISAAFDISWAHLRLLDDTLMDAEHLKLNREAGTVDASDGEEDCGHKECKEGIGGFEKLLKSILK